MIVGVLTEATGSERRVSLVPAVVPMLQKAGHQVLAQRGAGAQAGFADDAYEAAGARLVADRDAVLAEAEVLPLLGAPGDGRLDPARLRAGQVVVGLLDPLGAPEAMRTLAERGVTAFALELLPRISRAQPMDALTSMATVAGYRAVLLAAGALDKMFPLMMTAAGTVTPAKVLVLGAGVAGLQAIATARRLGAVVEAYDVRAVVREQVESLGAKFVDLEMGADDAETTGGYAKAMGEDFTRRQQEGLAKVVSSCDVVFSTAAIPGRRAPVLVTAEAVAGMRPGAVVVDLAAETGGNCALTKAGETVNAGGVQVMGPAALAASAPRDASQMYARNVLAFLRLVTKDGALRLDPDDEITRDSLVARDGDVVSARVRQLLGLPERRTD
jgi:NAD(P) transhydrogenase subunit alpha